ncbi:MAG: hypothetical protein WC511_02230 [Candidatus Pacearchaeota archaeon]
MTLQKSMDKEIEILVKKYSGMNWFVGIGTTNESIIVYTNTPPENIVGLQNTAGAYSVKYKNVGKVGQ